MKLIPPDQICELLAASNGDRKLMLHLILNTTISTYDLARLRLTDINGDWLDTGGRVCPLWPETVAAYRDWLAERPTPTPSVKDRIFVETLNGRGWSKSSRISILNERLRDCFREAKLDVPRTGLHKLRKTLRTVATEHGCDPVAVIAIERGGGRCLPREKLTKVTDTVRNWLWA